MGWTRREASNDEAAGVGGYADGNIVLESESLLWRPFALVINDWERKKTFLRTDFIID